MRRSRFILLMIMLLPVVSFAQTPGFHSKRFGLSLGTCLNSSYIYFGTDQELRDQRINSLLPPKVNLDMYYAISRRTEFHLGMSFYPMPHSLFIINSSQSNPNSEVRRTDSILLRSNMISLYIGFRRYSQFTSYGKYWAIGAAGNYYSTEIFPTTHRITEVNGIITENEIEKLETGVQWSYNAAFYLGRGRKFVFKNYNTLDFGLNVWLFPLQDNPYNSNESYRAQLRPIIDYVLTKRSREAHFLEFYLKFGFLL